MPVADKKTTQKPAENRTASGEQSQTFTDPERAAMKARAQEQKAEARRGRRTNRTNKEDGENDALAAIAAMREPDRAMAERIHAIVKASAPDLAAKTWYGMPAYAKDGKVVCFFQSAQKFNVRYATFGFNEAAHLDDGTMWPIAFALTELTADTEQRIAALVKQAVS